MSDNSVSGLIKATLTGKVFVVCFEEGVMDRDRVMRYENAILNKLQKKNISGASMAELEQTLFAELEHLRKILRGEIDDDLNVVEEQMLHFDEGETEDISELDEFDLDKLFGISDEPADDDELDEPEEAAAKEQQPRKSSGYKPESMDMHEKLEIQRKPVAELIKSECVSASLLSSKRAKHWVHNMSGRVKEEVETEIVAELAQNLHDKVKNYIRKNKGENPWSTPQLQNDLRSDIMSVKTVKGILLLSAQINQEVDRHEAGKKPGVFKRLWKKKQL